MTRNSGPHLVGIVQQSTVGMVGLCVCVCVFVYVCVSVHLCVEAKGQGHTPNHWEPGGNELSLLEIVQRQA